MTLTPSTQLDDQDRFIIACAINLYCESLRRISNRKLLTGQDIDPLLAICDELVKKKPWSAVTAPDAPNPELDEEEQKSLLTIAERRV